MPRPIADAAMLTDFYELTMMQGYWATGRWDEVAAFELYFRTIPEKGGYAIAAGIEDALDFATSVRFLPEHCDYLASQQIFRPAFVEFLAGLRFRGTIRAVEEGTLVFPNEPIVEVVAPLGEAQWLESALLNTINFHTLVATKASRMVREAHPAKVIEFGLRRSQGPDGALSAAQAAHLGGCVGTSNTQAGFRLGIPVFGTHAHSWVMSFESDEAAFRAYADVYPDHSTFLLDTYDTLRDGLPAAIAVGKEMAAAGHTLIAVRLDSGDLAYLSKACRAALDAAGLANVKILASSDVDEHVIRDLKAQGAPIDLYGVGTRLVTAYQEPALNGVYKLCATRDGVAWRPRLKLSSNPAKTTIPGRKQVWRWESAGGRYLGDCLALIDEPAPTRMTSLESAHLRTSLEPGQLRPLLHERMREGHRFGSPPSLDVRRARVVEELNRLPEEHRRLSQPHLYRVGLSDELGKLRSQMIEERSRGPRGAS